MKDHGSEIGWIDGTQALDPVEVGQKAALLAAAAAAGLCVPPAMVLPPSLLADMGTTAPLIEAGLARLGRAVGARLGDAAAPLLVSVRPSAPGGGGGLAPAILNLGLTAAMMPGLAGRLGEHAAGDLRRRLIQSYGTGVLGIEGEEFEYALYDALKAAGATSEAELTATQLARLSHTCQGLIADQGAEFPDDAHAQVMGAIAAMDRGWRSARARARRAARGLDPEAPLAVIVQAMVLGLGPEPSGAGIAHTRDEATGARTLSGRYLRQAQGEDALMGLRTPCMLTAAERQAMGQHEPALDEICPGAAAELVAAGAALEQALGDAHVLEFTLAAGRLHVLEVKPAKRSARAAVHILVDLAQAGVISREEAVMRVDPGLLDEHLHPTLDAQAPRDLIGQGLPASPGAASGGLVFSPDAAEAAAAAGRPAILALIETSPEDIRGMHAASGVLTVRGGMTSHAAVVARGLGRPCIVGAKDLVLDRASGTLRSRDGRAFHEGDVVTVDGGEGQVLAGAMPTRAPEITGAFATLMDWADAARRMGVRANADTGQDAKVARGFNAAGIGLCRTEHMFFKKGRISAMRRMIIAETMADRRAALDELLPMQRGDFIELFAEMAGLPVVIRLLDPPLHEFLPHSEAEMVEMAAQLDVPVSKIAARAREMDEFNPMLGKRGCRLGIAHPEIYRMQARAIFEAAIEAGHREGRPVRPEIMIPLISVVQELVVLKGHIAEVAAEVRTERGAMVDYAVGVMIETPRAALRAGDIAAKSDFFSFGTNDLTQMLYGLSRDDAGRFMPEYVAQGIFPHDPFHTLDQEGVGEIMQIATDRARARVPDLSIGLCGEHGGDPRSVDFCEQAGFDYVSCSPYRVPIARLAAAQATIRARRAWSAT